MASGLLSLKWNNHRSTFFQVLSTIRQKESYCDVTIACDGRFYSLHKFVLSTCSEYFEEMFERTNCKNPVIVLKDISCDELEALLNYMYVGEVNVVQEKLSGLIKAAECLKIKGLAVPDEDPTENDPTIPSKRAQRSEDSPRAKRRRKDSDVDEVVNNSRPRQSNSKSRDILHINSQQPKNSTDNHFQSNDAIRASSNNDLTKNSSKKDRGGASSSVRKSEDLTEVSLIEDEIKPEPIDNDETSDNFNSADHNLSRDNIDEEDNKEYLQEQLAFESTEGDQYADNKSILASDQHMQVMEELGGTYQQESFSIWDSTEGGNVMGEGSSGSGLSHQMILNHEFTHLQSSSSASLLNTSASSHVHGDIIESEQRHYEAHEKSNGSLVNKYYKCKYCDYVSAARVHMHYHIRKHTQMQPHCCNFCGRKFTLGSNLTRHVKKIHQP